MTVSIGLGRVTQNGPMDNSGPTAPAWANSRKQQQQTHMLEVCCCVPDRWEMRYRSIAAQRTLANAGSALCTAKGRS